ncbi:MAG: acylneuraminate cytidylyltransferase family protein [Nitrospinota bacterium]
MAVVISLIPARGGSKGIPRKNLAPLANKPLIAHSIEDSLNCTLIKRTIVSTDDEEIAEVARNLGAEVPFIRPMEFAEDDTPDFPVFLHALEWLKDNEGFAPDLVVQLRPTTPIRPPGLIERGIEMLSGNSEADCVRTVRKSPITPYKMWQLDGNFLKPFIQLEGKESYNMPRQKLPWVFQHDGVLDVIRTSTLLNKNSVTGSKILPLFMDESFLTVDIDKPVDLLIAEAFINYNQQHK